MRPYDAASADRAINITLHRREIDLLKKSDYESCGMIGCFPAGLALGVSLTAKPNNIRFAKVETTTTSREQVRQRSSTVRSSLT